MAEPVTICAVGWPITIKQTSKRPARYTVSYGQDVHRCLSYVEAAEAIGYSVMHSLCAESKIEGYVI